MFKTYTVYMHTNMINGKIYVGVTSQKVENRWRKNGEGYKNQAYFYRSIIKYGWDNFKHEILTTGLSAEEAKNEEIRLIAYKNANNPSKGYNIGLGGESNIGYKLSEEQKIKLRNCHLGRKLSEEHKRKLSIAGMGRVVSEETRKKISDSNKGKIKGRSPWCKGLKLSKEHVRKMADSHRGKKHTDEHRRKISEASKGEKHPNFGTIWGLETRLKMSIAKQGLYDGENHPFYGKHHSDKSKLQISEKKRIKISDIEMVNISNMYAEGVALEEIAEKFSVSWATIRRRLIENGTHEKFIESRKESQIAKTIKTTSKKVINLDTGIVFESQTQASSFYNIGNKHISSCCNGKRKTSGGYRWAYAI